MTSLTRLCEQPLIHAVGWSLLHFLWQGALVALLLASALRVLSNRSSQLRYMAAACALVLMAASPLVTFGLLAVNASAENQALSYRIAETHQRLSLRSDVSGPARPWMEDMVEALDHSLPWVLATWFTGTTLLLCRLNIGLIVARRMKSISTQPVAIELQRVFHDVSRRLGVVRPVSLVNSVLVQVPTVIGWLRPAVLLPVGCLTGLSTIQIEAIFAHELAHIRRHDYLVSIFQSIVEAVLFYHPAVWWVSKQVRREREECCDDLAVSISGDRLAYAKALSFLEERRAPLPAVALNANGGELALRIKRLLGYEEPPASWWTATTLCAVVVAAAALCMGTFAGGQTNAGDQSSVKGDGVPHSTDAQYQRWVDEDVLWIIAPEERAAYLKLSTGEERDEFIRQFWQRRDAGAPGGNDVRAEHYRRVAYANQHFAAGVPGWKTDRGRIYIMYGPPNSIEAHSVGVAQPYELWHYREIKEFGQAEQVQGTPNYKTTIVTRKDVDMKFVDACRCGEFQLQPARN